MLQIEALNVPMEHYCQTHLIRHRVIKYYSLLKLTMGLTCAALIVFNPTVHQAIIRDTTAAIAKIVMLMVVR